MPKSSWEVVISIDPATTSGYAILYSEGGPLDRDRLLEYGVVKDSEFTGRSMMEVIARAAWYVEAVERVSVGFCTYLFFRESEKSHEVFAIENARWRLRVVIEDQFLRVPHKGGMRIKSNPDTLKKVARFSGAWRAMAQCACCPSSSVEFVQPHEWQSSMLNIGKVDGAKRTALKNASQELVRVLYGRLVTQDEADAICLGSYYARARRIDGRNVSEVQEDELCMERRRAAIEKWGTVEHRFPRRPVRPAR